MSKKLALFLTVVIFAGITFCFFRPVDSEEFVTYGEFGNIKSVYVEGNLDIPFTVSGETDLLTVTRLAFDGEGRKMIYFQPAEGRQFSMGSVDVNMLVDAWDDSASFDLATVERYEEDGWTHYRDIDVFSFARMAIHYTVGPSVIYKENCDFGYPLWMPYIEPGRYRVTFNFREVFGDRDSGYTSDETVHHISVEYEVPAESESRYDVVYFVVLEPEWRHFTRTYLALRANDGGEAPFRRFDKVDVEILRGGRWVRQDIASKNAVPGYYQRNGRSDPRYSEYHIDMISPLEPNSDYRLTLYFAEKDQGTDYMPLQIHIRTADE